MRNADLRGTYFRGVNLYESDLSRTDVIAANPTRAYLQKGNLSGAILNYSIVRGINFSGANLNGADLRHTDLTDVNLTRTDLPSLELSPDDLDTAVHFRTLGLLRVGERTIVDVNDSSI